MIINLKYLEKQWIELRTADAPSSNVADPNARKNLYAFTVVQFWFQLISIVLIINYSYLVVWHNEVKSKNYTTMNGYGEFYLCTSMWFQLCDIFLTVYASFDLRSPASMYENIQEVKLWTVANNLYLVSSIVCFLLVTKTVDMITILIKGIIICLFTCYKIHIIYRIYKNEKSSYIFLEQDQVPPDESSPKSTNDEPQLSNIMEIATVIDETRQQRPIVVNGELNIS